MTRQSRRQFGKSCLFAAASGLTPAITSMLTGCRRDGGTPAGKDAGDAQPPEQREVHEVDQLEPALPSPHLPEGAPVDARERLEQRGRPRGQPALQREDVDVGVHLGEPNEAPQLVSTHRPRAARRPRARGAPSPTARPAPPRSAQGPRPRASSFPSARLPPMRAAGVPAALHGCGGQCVRG